MSEIMNIDDLIEEIKILPIDSIRFYAIDQDDRRFYITLEKLFELFIFKIKNDKLFLENEK
jgi:hypothetical protein